MLAHKGLWESIESYMGDGMQELRSSVSGLGFRVQGLGLRVVRVSRANLIYRTQHPCKPYGIRKSRITTLTVSTKRHEAHMRFGVLGFRV